MSDPIKRRGRPEKPLDAPDTPLGRFGAQLRQLRHTNGLSQRELAARAGCDPSAVSQCERAANFRPGAELAEIFDHELKANGLLVSLYLSVVHEQAKSRRTRTAESADIAPLELPDGDLSEWVGDVTIPDGTMFAPGTPFVKIWRLRNAGTVLWEGRYLKRIGPLAAVGQVSTIELTPIPRTKPGELVDIAVHCKAHTLPGSSIARFKFSDRLGRLYFPSTNPEGIVLAITVDDSLRRTS